ncbi:MAG: Minf_1886 family protein [Candidatus Eiseniibacteriota bacterium]
MSHPEVPFWEAVDALRARDPRYRREAYGFVVAALAASVSELPLERRNDPGRRHLSGAELVLGVVRLARREFGDLSEVVFREWNVTRSEDIGRIVFELVECGQLSARPEDRLQDFLEAPEFLGLLAAGARAPAGG